SPLPHPLTSTLFPYTTLFRSYIALKPRLQYAYLGLQGSNNLLCICVCIAICALVSQVAHKSDLPDCVRDTLICKVYEPLARISRSEEHTSELQSPDHLVCRLL